MSTTSDFVVDVGKGDYSELIIRSGLESSGFVAVRG